MRLKRGKLLLVVGGAALLIFWVNKLRTNMEV